MLPNSRPSVGIRRRPQPGSQDSPGAQGRKLREWAPARSRLERIPTKTAAPRRISRIKGTTEAPRSVGSNAETASVY